MKKKFILFFIVIGFVAFSQTKKDTLSSSKSHFESYSEQKKSSPFSDNGQFLMFDLTVPFRGNDTYGEIDENGNRSDYWFLPDGIGAKFGYGIHFSEWIGLSLNTGIDVVAQQKLVSVPVYTSLVLYPKIYGEKSLLIQYGFGKSFALGRGNLSGFYNKFRIGFGNEIILFADISLNGFAVKNIKKTGSFSLGITIPFFR